MINKFIDIDGAVRVMGITRIEIFDRLASGTFPSSIESDLNRFSWALEEVQAIAQAIRDGACDRHIKNIIGTIYYCRKKPSRILPKAFPIYIPGGGSSRTINARDIFPLNGYVSVQELCDKDRKDLGLDNNEYAYGKIVRGQIGNMSEDNADLIAKEDMGVAFKRDRGLKFISGLERYLLVKESDLMAILAI